MRAPTRAFWSGPLLLLGWTLGVPPAMGAPTPEQVADAVAIVDGVLISRAEFEAEAARKTPANGVELSAAEKQAVLDGLVEEKALYAEALRLGLDKDPKIQKIIVNLLLRQAVFESIKNSDFTDQMLHDYYDSHRADFIVPEKVQIKRIELKVTVDRSDAQARAACESIRQELLRSPDGFATIAAERSDDVYKHRGGDVGFVSREGKPGLDPLIVSTAFALPTGAFSTVFRTADGGWNVIQVASRRERLERTFEEMKGSVLRRAKNARLDAAEDAYAAPLRAHATVKVNQAAIDAMHLAGATTAPGESDAPGINPADPGDEAP